MTTLSTSFVLVAAGMSILIPYLFMRDIRSRYPSLWATIGSPGQRDSFASLVSKTVKGLRRLAASPAIPESQRLYCLRWWWALVIVYVLTGGALLIALAGRYHNVTH